MGRIRPGPTRWDPFDSEKSCHASSKGGPVGVARVWEWVVDEGADHALSGVSGTRYRAMTALSRTLITVGTPASGRVVPISLVQGAYGFSYVRLAPVLTADCEKGVIKWRGTSN
jgi:hypothetical protein